MKKLILLNLLLLALAFRGFSQCDSILCNSRLTGNFGNYSGNFWNQFRDGFVDCWSAYYGSPQLARQFRSTPSAATFWAQLDTVTGIIHRESISQSVDIVNNEWYAISFSCRMFPNTNGRGSVRLRFMQANNQANQQTASRAWVFRNQSNYRTINRCIQANNNYDLLVIDGVPRGSNVFWPIVDDVEIYKVSADAGEDTSFCDTNSCVYLGNDCQGQPLGLNRTINWYVLGNPTPFAHTSKIQVCPKTTTTYIQEVIFVSGTNCVDYDSVTITVSHVDSFDLGPNDTICGPIADTLSGPYDSTYYYSWNTGDTTQSIIVNKSGKYKLTVWTDEGCSYTDSIYLVFWPEVKVYPTDTMICPSSAFPITARADSGYTYYEWFNGDTTATTQIYSTGTYWVKVGYPGCYSIDTIKVRTFDDFLYIGKDRYVCEGTPVIICDTNENYEEIIHYRWNTGDTTRCITVYAQGTYSLFVWPGNDTLCGDSISVDVTVVPVPDLSCTQIGPFCPNDTNKYLITCDPDTNLIFSGKGVHGYYFHPRLAGIGTHQITVFHTVYTDPICFSSTQFNLTVLDSPKIEIEHIDPVCITDAPFYLHAEPPGGTFSGAVNDSLIDPDSLGLGTHYVYYSYTDPNGCSGTDSMFVLIGDTFDVWINASNNYLCEGNPVTLKAKRTNGEVYFCVWNTDEVTPNITVTQSGTYTVFVYDTSYACLDTASIEIEFINCCDPEEVDATEPFNSLFTVQSYITDSIINDTIFVDEDIVVERYGKLYIYNSQIYMRNCSKIIVERGGYLEIENSEVGLCDWQGIEVWGNYDACPTDLTWQGQLIMNNSKLNHADIGILVGKSDPSGIPYYDYTYCGGIIQVTHDTFEDNYIHILHEDWNIAAPCSCGTANGIFQHQIHYNHFGCLADTINCSERIYYVYRLNWVKNNARTFKFPTNPQIPMFQSRCHIMDLAAYKGYAARFGGYAVCPVSIFKNNDVTLHPSGSSGNATFGNTYCTDCTPCYCNDKEPYKTHLK
jgi:hypothetical protein